MTAQRQGLIAAAGARARRPARPLWQFALACMLSFAGTLASAAAPGGGETAALERDVKAAFLYKFVGYVGWPEEAFTRPDAPVTIAVMGDDPLAEVLAQLVAGRTVDGRQLAVRKQKDDDLPSDTHILFIARAESAHLKARGKLLRPILIVTESEGALAHGSAINFLISGGRVRFEVSLEAVEKRRLKVSSRLLTVAQNVRKGAP